MRVAPMALLMAGYKGRGTSFYDIPVMDEAGAKVAEVTHKHPLGFCQQLCSHILYIKLSVWMPFKSRDI